jgi:hypothetical protein
MALSGLTQQGSGSNESVQRDIVGWAYGPKALQSILSPVFRVSMVHLSVHGLGTRTECLTLRTYSCRTRSFIMHSRCFEKCLVQTVDTIMSSNATYAASTANPQFTHLQSPRTSTPSVSALGALPRLWTPLIVPRLPYSLANKKSTPFQQSTLPRRDPSMQFPWRSARQVAGRAKDSRTR